MLNKHVHLLQRGPPVLKLLNHAQFPPLCTLSESSSLPSPPPFEIHRVRSKNRLVGRGPSARRGGVDAPLRLYEDLFPGQAAILEQTAINSLPDAIATLTPYVILLLLTPENPGMRADALSNVILCSERKFAHTPSTDHPHVSGCSEDSLSTHRPHLSHSLTLHSPPASHPKLPRDSLSARFPKRGYLAKVPIAHKAIISPGNRRSSGYSSLTGGPRNRHERGHISQRVHVALIRVHRNPIRVQLRDDLLRVR